jgi:alpha-mannosidase
MIGNAHIDPVWLWRADEGFDEVRRTCLAALDRMEETDGFIFCRSSAATYQWLEENEPDLFGRIRERVAEGRWNIVGGWWVQPDCNIPCGESFVRQALHGKRYFREKFGVDVRVGYNVDSFGHSAQLPQILHKCGLDSYVFFRPGPHEKELPSGLFAWQAPDGSQVVACRPPHHYNTAPDEIAERIEQAAGRAPLGLDHVMCFYGVGDHGGGPTKANIASILQAPSAEFSTPERFFAAVSGAKLPVVAEELQHHARGCYSALSAIKEANHEAERLLLTAERFAAIAAGAFFTDRRQDDLRPAWEKALFHQFHDILAGTSIPEAYEDAWAEYDAIRKTALEVITDSLEIIGLQLDTVGPGEPVTFFNSLSWEREEVVEVQLPQGMEPVLLDSRFEQAPLQIEDGHAVFRVRVPSLGFTCYRLSDEHAPAEHASSLVADAGALENEFFRLQVDPATGCLASLVDKRTGVELLSGPGAALVVLEDGSDTWAHGVDAFRDEVGRFEPVGLPELIENGPVRAAIRVRYRWGQSGAEQTFYVYDGLARVDACLIVDWHERHKMLKLAFPTAIADVTWTAAVPYGAVVRPTTGEEEPIQRWMDTSGRVGDVPAGLALANDGRYGADALDGEMRLSLLRSPIYAFHDPREVEPGVEYPYTDQGEHIIRYRLIPHGGSWQDTGVVREAEGLNAPVYYRFETIQDGTVPSTLSAVDVEPDHVMLSVLKHAEDGDALIVRLAETAGRPAPEAGVDIQFADLSWRGELGPFELKTLRFDLETKDVVEVDMLEQPLA